MLLKSKRLKSLKNYTKVKRLDQYRCVLCGYSSNLHIHYIKTKGAGGGDEIENLITLCFGCHRKIHDMGRQILYQSLKQKSEFEHFRFQKFIEEYENEMHS